MAKVTGSTNDCRVSLFALAACVVALGLRVYNLTFQTLWWDEGISLYLAGLSVGDLTVDKDFALDLHPPLYHLLLAAWTGIAGPSVFSARFLSVFLGVVNVPLLYVLGRRLAGPHAGLVAACLLAIAPVHIYYSQESRMYTLLPLVATLSVLAFVALLTATGRRERTSAAVSYAVVTPVGLYSYYYIALLIAAQWVVFMLYWLKYRRGARLWLASQAGTALLFIPWLGVMGTSLLGSTGLLEPGALAGPGEPLQFLRTFALAYTVGFSVVEPWGPLGALLFLCVAALGLVGRWRWWGGKPLAVLCIVVPVALTYAIATQRAFVFPRFVLFVALALYLLAGAGVALAWCRLRPVAVGIAVLLVASTALSLSHQYHVPRTAYASSDYLVSLAEVAERVQPGDLLLSNQAWLAGYARSYMPAPQPEVMWAPSAWNEDAALARADLAALLAERRRLWLLDWHEGGQWQMSAAESALEEVGAARFVDQYGEFRLRLFTQAGLPPEEVASKATFADTIALADWRAEGPQRLYPGAEFELVLTWQGLTEPDADYTVFTQLLGPDGKVYAQHDGQPVAGSRRTSVWHRGEVVVDRHHLAVDPAAPPGEYRLIVGLYDATTGGRLSTGEADFFTLRTYTVESG